jgi:hypothetical protein
LHRYAQGDEITGPLLGSLERETNWEEFSQEIALETLGMVADVATNPEKPGVEQHARNFQKSTLLPSVGGFTVADVSLVVRSLWEDRESFFTLCTRRWLPGCTVLFYAFFQIILPNTESK